MTLDSFLENQSMHKIDNTFEFRIPDLNISNLKIWQPVKDLEVDYNLTLSKKLKDIKNIDMVSFLSD